MAKVLRKKEIYPSRVMNPICEEHGCSEDDASKHAWKWEKKRWHSHPSQDFVAWWEPFEFDAESGVSAGGHPDARRCWARKDLGGWKRRWFGTDTEVAWNTGHWFNQFEAWRLSARPAKPLEFVSIAATLDQQKQFWKGLKDRIAQIAKTVPKPMLHHYDPVKQPLP